MKCKCPACGAVMSLDVLLQHDEASNAVMTALSINQELGKALVKYIGLFRPQKSSLTMDRLANLLNQLLPDIQAQRISRNGDVYQAPVACWVECIYSVLANRHTLSLPLKSHGYLYEVMSKWQGQVQAQSAVVIAKNNTPNSSKTAKALQNLAEFANGE